MERDLSKRYLDPGSNAPFHGVPGTIEFARAQFGGGPRAHCKAEDSELCSTAFSVRMEVIVEGVGYVLDM